MEVRHLRYLLAVIEEANFTRAAHSVHIAQPGLSAQIRQLEDELGHPLLDRSQRAVRATAVGNAILPYAKAALEALEDIRRIADEFSGVLRGHVRVGTISSCPPVNLPMLLSEFHHAYPKVSITLSEGRSDQLLSALVAGDVDLALIGVLASTPPQVQTQNIIEEPIVAVVDNKDVLSSRKSVTLLDLSDRNLICMPEGTGLRSVINQAFESAAIKPTIAFEASDPRNLIDLARNGLGVAFVPLSAARAFTDGITPIAVRGRRLRGQIALAWRSSDSGSPAVKKFIEQARRAMSALDGRNSHAARTLKQRTP